MALLAAASASSGVRVLRYKTRSEAHRQPWDLGLAALVVFAAMAIAGYGIWRRVPLFAAFAPVGVIVGGGQLFYWLQPPATRLHWWFEHMGSMLASSIGALTAFVVVNAPRLGLGRFSIAAWLAPSLVGVPVTYLWTRYYRRRFAAAEDAQARHRPDAQAA